MSNLTVRLQDQGLIPVRVQEQSLSTIQASVYHPAVINQLSDIRDVDVVSLVNGSVLVYKTATSKWTATTLLDQQNIDCGEF